MSQVRYILRHAFPGDAQVVDAVMQGYGVQLDIKNMEYKALDDRPPQALDGDEAGTASEGESQEEEAVAGVLFSKLRARRPELSDKLDELKVSVSPRGSKHHRVSATL